MSIVQRGRQGKKTTGGKYLHNRSKRKFEKGSVPSNTSIGKTLIKTSRTKGGSSKSKALRITEVNLFDPKVKKFSKAEVKMVVENKANRNFVRRNIITAGTVIETDKGKAKITSRPGQNGSVNAVLI